MTEAAASNSGPDEQRDRTELDVLFETYHRKDENGFHWNNRPIVIFPKDPRLGFATNDARKLLSCPFIAMVKLNPYSKNPRFIGMAYADKKSADELKEWGAETFKGTGEVHSFFASGIRDENSDRKAA